MIVEGTTITIKPIALPNASQLHQLYLATPSYFNLLGSPVPSLQEVIRDIETALYDPRRKLELLYIGRELVGSLDYKVNYPYQGDVTINLLMMRGDMQSRGLGKAVVRDLERRLTDDPRMGSQRLLASVLGDNQRAIQFWERLGFTFATDARPVMTWYAKQLQAQPLHAATVS